MSPQQSKEDLISSGRVIILGGFDLTEAASQRPGQSHHRLYKPTHCPPSDCYIYNCQDQDQDGVHVLALSVVVAVAVAVPRPMHTASHGSVGGYS